MTSYHGGKYRHGEEIATVIKDIYDKQPPDSIIGYIEPFCGMCGVYRHIVNLLPKNLKYIASDQHDSLILMWKALQNGWVPPKDCSVKKYEKLKYSKPSPEKAYFGFGISFGGVYFSGHRKIYNCNVKINRNDIMKISNHMKHVKFQQNQYNLYTNCKNYIIYCDPPYDKTVSTNKYYNDKTLEMIKFDTKLFWEWCRKMSKHNIVLISEFIAPSDFKSLLSFNSSNNSQLGDTKIEHLFIHDSLLN